MTDQLPAEKKKRGANLKGRPKGVLNKTTLFKQVMQEGFEVALEKDFKKVLRTVIDKAIDGDMVAAKMLLDRVVPTSKAIDLDDLAKSKGLTISINVGSLEDKKAIEAQVIEDGEIIE
jgi:hypothetical protein